MAGFSQAPIHSLGLKEFWTRRENDQVEIVQNLDYAPNPEVKDAPTGISMKTEASQLENFVLTDVNQLLKNLDEFISQVSLTVQWGTKEGLVRGQQIFQYAHHVAYSNYSTKQYTAPVYSMMANYHELREFMPDSVNKVLDHYAELLFSVLVMIEKASISEEAKLTCIRSVEVRLSKSHSFCIHIWSWTKPGDRFRFFIWKYDLLSNLHLLELPEYRDWLKENQNLFSSRTIPEDVYGLKSIVDRIENLIEDNIIIWKALSKIGRYDIDTLQLLSKKFLDEIQPPESWHFCLTFNSVFFILNEINITLRIESMSSLKELWGDKFDWMDYQFIEHLNKIDVSKFLEDVMYCKLSLRNYLFFLPKNKLGYEVIKEEPLICKDYIGYQVRFVFTPGAFKFPVNPDLDSSVNKMADIFLEILSDEEG